MMMEEVEVEVVFAVEPWVVLYLSLVLGVEFGVGIVIIVVGIAVHLELALVCLFPGGGLWFGSASQVISSSGSPPM